MPVTSCHPREKKLVKEENGSVLTCPQGSKKILQTVLFFWEQTCNVTLFLSSARQPRGCQKGIHWLFSSQGGLCDVQSEHIAWEKKILTKKKDTCLPLGCDPLNMVLWRCLLNSLHPVLKKSITALQTSRDLACLLTRAGLKINYS